MTGRSDISDVKSTMNVWKIKKKRTLGKSIYQERVSLLISESMFVFKITSCDLLGILYRIHMFHVFLEKNFESKERKKKRKRKRKKNKEGRKEERKKKNRKNNR